ncbi:MAG: dihydroorotate dehydrogenase electron transfer subunit [Lachnospiraceae bacterium]|nr:dihydroorotate dehydrogenase electron transfer subunit [Lachnospiraceae bacterium]
MSKVKEQAKVLNQESIAPGIYSLWLQTAVADSARRGQFVSLYCNEHSRVLPRPISICEIDGANHKLRLVYRVVGAGTDEFSKLEAGDEIEIMGPLGNGFEIEGKTPVVIGGGIGVPPMLQLARDLKATGADVHAVMGYRDSNLFLENELRATSTLHIATDDGSVGCHGTVVDALKEANFTPDVIYACGPKPMLRALKEYAMERDIKCYVSMEERMACGVGACLGCVCQTTGVDDHSKVHNTRVCKDGPVFLAQEVEL